MKQLLFLFAFLFSAAPLVAQDAAVQDVAFKLALEGNQLKASQWCKTNYMVNPPETGDGDFTYRETEGNWVLTKTDVWLYFADYETFTKIYYELSVEMGAPEVSKSEGYTDYLFSGYYWLSKGDTEEDGYHITLPYQDPADFGK